jgi:hypothetical protein
LSNKIFYGEQKTEEWHSLRLGLFTSSTIHHLFEDSSKQAKAIALMQQLKEGTWMLDNAVLNHRPTPDDLTYICKYLVEYKFIKKLDVPILKKDLKAILKDGFVLSGNDSFKECLLILTACYAMHKIEVASGSMTMLCKKKALELIYEAPDMELDGIAAIEWGNENEGLARQVFEEQTLEILDAGDKKISFVQNFNLQTGSSPDDTIQGVSPVEYKNPWNKGIHYDHWQIKNADQLLQFDKQKYYQLQHQIWMLGAKFGYFVSFGQRLLNTTKFKHKALFVLKVDRNEKVMQQFEPRLMQAIEVRNKFIENF